MCLYKGIGADSRKPHDDDYFLTLANKDLFLWRDLEISSVLLFSKVSGSAKMMETFSGKQRSQRFEPHWYGEALSYRNRFLDVIFNLATKNTLLFKRLTTHHSTSTLFLTTHLQSSSNYLK